MVAIARPADIFNRTHEWEDLARFAADGAPGLRIGIVRGRRRHGKSFLLEHVCRAVHGAYLLALQESRTMALDHFSDALGRWLGFRVGRLASWAEALDTAVESLSRIGVPLLVLDESRISRRTRRNCRRLSRRCTTVGGR